MSEHRDLIVQQFTLQAVPFSMAPGVLDAAALERLIEASRVASRDTVLDVACGPGVVVRAFAAVAQSVTGIDVTPAMIARARELNAGLPNVTLLAADLPPLPFPDESFSVVVCRYAFHHFQRPAAVLAEMRRVCRAGGSVVVCDLLASDDPHKAAAFHRIEMLRDPSHVRALTVAELHTLFRDVGLLPETMFYDWTFNLEGMLSRSFPQPEHVEVIRKAYVDSVADDALGLRTRRVGDQVCASYRVAILRATCSDE